MATNGRLKGLLLKLWKSWATRSLAVGAVATALDLAVGGTLLWQLEAHPVFFEHVLGFFGTPTRVSAMVGTLLGSTFTFFANRFFAFREHHPGVAYPALRFILVTVASSVVHGQLVVILRDRWGVPYVPSKMIADVCVFTFAQLFVLRYIVFPKPKGPTASPSA
jgi:putative flippase GtrA